MIKRRKFCTLAAAFLLIAGLSSSQATAQTKDDAIFVFDLWKFFERERIESTAQRADFAYFTTALQGIVNRDKPRLYVIASLSLMDIEVQSPTRSKDEIEVTPIDEFWLEELISHGDINARSIVRTASLMNVLDHFQASVKGLAVWEMKVPATINAALTASGVEDLLPVSQDLGNGRVIKWLKNHGYAFPIALNLVGSFGNAKAGETVWVNETRFKSSGSEKTDDYHFIHTAFLRTDRSSPFHMVFNPDALMWSEKQKIYGAGRFGHLSDRLLVRYIAPLQA